MDITNTAYFHEDDYNQIEIIPIENFFITIAEIEDLNKVSSNYFSQQGFDQIYSRKGTLQSLQQLNIKIKEIKSVLGELSFKYYNQVETGYSSSKIPKENCFAYGYENYSIFVSHENQIVKNIWITYSPTIIPEDKFPGNLVLTLLNIGNKWKVILIDWNEETVVFLHKKAAVEEYLNIITGFKFNKIK